MGMKTVLILCPHLTEKGGVADYYRHVKNHFISDKIALEYYYTGSTANNNSTMDRLKKSIKDLLNVISMVRNKDLIVLNPSLDAKAVIRDGIFHFVVKRVFQKKTLVFFHGWDPKFEETISKYAKFLFKMLFNFDKSVVLATQFKNTFISWGYKPDRVSLETTVYEFIDGVFVNDPLKIVFLSRFVQGKGCLEAIQTTELLKDEFQNIKLYMAGDGDLAAELHDYVIRKNLSDYVEFTGWLDGESKYQLLRQCGIMLYPTAFGEGMPLCLLEGMGMGLVIVTRPVAGIEDIFKDEENGYLVTTLEPRDFADKIRFILGNKTNSQKISQNNKQQSVEKFEIRSVVKRLEPLYLGIAQ